MIGYADLGWWLVLLLAVAAAAWGFLGTFASGMSSAADDGSGRRSCWLALAGLAAFVFAVWKLLQPFGDA